MCYTFREYTKTRQAPPAGERSPGARRKEVMSVTNILLVCAVLLPLLGGALLPLLPTGNRKGLHGTVLALLILEAGVVTALLLRPEAEFFLFAMTDSLTVSLRMDGISKLFLAVGAYGFLITGVYAFRYLEPGGREKSFFAFFLLALGALAGMDLAANLTTMYLFFELLTLCSMPMVLHDRTQESIRAALKYLFYSMAGAFLALCTIFVLSRFCGSLSFNPGGSLDPAKIQGHETLLRVVVFLGVVGFGAKAGLYPLHGWLPAAHPVAPAPASAVMSGIIAKAGVLAILRLIYFCVGTEFLAGTWVQYAWLGLALLTVFMGSMMAYRETAFKKRLAYSSVSQISYVLTGLFLLTPTGVLGGLLHVIFHACVKICLFLVAGSFIHNLGFHQVGELKAVGKAMPKTLWGFTLASLALVGIPPASGFISKWYLAEGALSSGLPVYDWLAPVILLISALLTAGYLLPITIDGFFPGKDCKSIPAKNDEGGPLMWVPIALLAAASLLLGVFSDGVTESLRAVAEGMF